MSESISNARLEANRANAQKSSGPRTRLGRSISCLNAVTCALTGATVVLPTDDAERYRAHILEYQGQFEPVGPEERALVQSIADTRWRLNRIPALEQAYLSSQEAEFTKLADLERSAEVTQVCFPKLTQVVCRSSRQGRFAERG